MKTPLSNYLFPSYNKDNFKKLWERNIKFDRLFVFLQSILILTFSYRENIWGLFVFISFISSFINLIIFFSKIIYGMQLSSMLRDLAKKEYIPHWIPARRRLIYIAFLIFNNPIVWFSVVIVTAHINSSFPLILVTIFSLPWIAVEWINRKERDYLKGYL